VIASRLVVLCIHLMPDLPGSVEDQTQRLKSLIQKLTDLIKQLPTTRPCGSKDGPIAKYFSDHTYDDPEGPYFTFNKAWERVFQCADNGKEHLVVQGKYGLDLVQAYVVHFSKVPGIEMNDGLHLVAQRVEALVTFLES
jgi:hypothetical protein